MLFSIQIVVGKWVDERGEPLRIGQFALPESQQAVPLVSFGQNILDKGDLLGIVDVAWLKGTQKSFSELIPSFIYGITNEISVLVELPFALKFQSEQAVSRGVKDLLLQVEGVVFAPEKASTIDEITLVANIEFPTGTLTEEPLTGMGTLNFFFGFTASYTGPEWYYFISSGMTLTTTRKKTKFGNEFLYQCGISKNISYRANKWLFNWMIELNGAYAQRDKISGLIDCNTGGNVLLLGPSLWFSTQRFLMQGGISGVVFEHLFGTQHKNKYFVAAAVGCKF